MSKTDCRIRVGTSGWHYNHWAGLFYPDGLPKNRWLQYYAERFDTVEVNNTFYQLPKQQTFKNWYRQAPKNFLYTVKANRYITHIKRLKDTSESLERFFERVKDLKDKLGPILYQLPPSLRKDVGLLEGFVRLVPKKVSAVFEFRDKSWYSEETFEVLGRLGVGFCIHDMPGNISPRIITGGMIYIRFHGPTGRYAGSYSKSAIHDWAKWIVGHTKEIRNVYVYFNNDYNAYAVNNAKQLKEQIEIL